jgi:hypothetical protein
MKTRETSGDRFHQFSENRPVKYEIFKNLKKNPKRTRVHFKFFGGIQKFKITHPTKFSEVKMLEK